jgi:hypothetical protein
MPSVDSAPVPIERDPEFRPRVPARRVAADLVPGSYHRILANPFLGLLGLVGWIGVLYALLARGAAGPSGPILAVLVLAGGLGLPRLFQFHCLDCGRTGPLRRWKQHVCPRVAQRHLAGRPRRFRGPPPAIQVVLWLFALLMTLVALRALGGE